jgi:formate dehydrogenase alpha subunit
MAQVVLPACSYAEKDGTFTNTEGHVQAVRQAIAPVGDSRPDWEILSALSVLMGYPLEYGDAKEIFKEIRSVIPGYGLLGPAPTPPRPDAAAVDRYLEQGYAEDLASRYALGAREGPRPVGKEAVSAGSGRAGEMAVGVCGCDGQEKNFTLLLSQTLFHSGKLSTRAKGLLQVQASAFLAMNPQDAARHGIAEGDIVRVVNDRGAAAAPAKLLDRVPEGLVVFPEHFDEDVRRLLSVSIDPQTGVPYYKSTLVSVEKT